MASLLPSWIMLSIVSIIFATLTDSHLVARDDRTIPLSAAAGSNHRHAKREVASEEQRGPADEETVIVIDADTTKLGSNEDDYEDGGLYSKAQESVGNESPILETSPLDEEIDTMDEDYDDGKERKKRTSQTVET